MIDVGSRVHIINNSPWRGTKGTVVEYSSESKNAGVYVTTTPDDMFDRQGDVISFPVEWLVEDREGVSISFEDIEKGDLIEVVEVISKETRVTSRGRADRLSGDVWHTFENVALADTNDTDIRLLDRPKKVWPVGTVILLEGGKVLSKTKEDTWHINTLYAWSTTHDAGAELLMRDNNWKEISG